MKLICVGFDAWWLRLTRFCGKHCKWIYGRCAMVKSVTLEFSKDFGCSKCEENTGMCVSQEFYMRNEV